MSLIKLAVIACRVDPLEGNNWRYFAYDREAGYPFWTYHLRHAHMFDVNDEQLRKEYDAIINGPEVVGSQGTKYPNQMLHTALELSSQNTKATGHIAILEITPTVSESKAVEGQIQVPRVYVY